MNPVLKICTLLALCGAAYAGPGQLDDTFGVGGIVTTHTAPGLGADYQNGIAIQPDGKVVVGGESDRGSEGGDFRWRISRYSLDGDLDRTFGRGGTVLTSMSCVGGFDERIIALAVQRDGKIVAVGWSQTSPSTQDSSLARYNSDGTLDTTFGNGGKVFTDVAQEPDHDFINQVLIDAHDRIVVAGGCRRCFVARYLPNGTLDLSFNANGPRPGIAFTEIALTNETNSEFLGLAIDQHERIVTGGYSTLFEDGFYTVNSAIARWLDDGTLDPSFNPHGDRPGTVITKVAPGDNWDLVFRVAVDAHGRILTAGDAYIGIGIGLYDIAVSRYLPNGTLDVSFGQGGIVLINAQPGDSDDDVQGLAIQRDGKILVGGSAAPTAFLLDSDFMVARLQSNGVLDSGFGQGGIVITPTAPNNADDEIAAMAIEGGSKLVASGESDRPGTGRDSCVVRYLLR